MEVYLRSFDVRLGSGTMEAPPCHNYLDLRPLCSLRSRVAAFDSATNKQEVDQIQKEARHQRKPLGGLLAAINTSRNEIRRALTQMLKDMQLKPMKNKDSC